jgi:hypothetical protein
MHRKTTQSASASALGILVCLVLSGSKIASFCVNSGCGIYSSYKFAGLSFYVWGALFFAAVLILSAVFQSYIISASVVAIAVIGDAGFLAYQSLFWPCTNCLLVALIVGILALVHVSDKTLPAVSRKLLVGALIVWVPFFSSAGISAVKEWAVTPYILNEPQDELVATVYFSPTCSSCEETVKELIASPDSGAIAFVPVAKSETDRRILAALPDKLSPSEIDSIFSKDAATSEPGLADKLKLWRNQSALASLGYASVPVVVGNSIPQLKSEQSFFTGTSLPLSYPASTAPESKHDHTGSCQMFQADPECGI